ncbi:MAG: hypothetical protein R2780_03675 [Crocinitomicaceae bacterium]|nr:hypothetical protein [Crocinitomicaceae bacterium]
MIKRLLGILFLILPLSSFLQEDDGNKLYEHQLDEEKWEKIRDGIRYEGHENGPGRRWTYESDKEYNDAKKRYGSGSGNGNGGGGNGSGGSGSGASSPRSNTPPPRTSTPPRFNPPNIGGLGTFGYVLLIIFIAAIAVLIFYMFLKAPRDGKSVGAPIEIEDVNPTEIPLSELQRLLQEALSKGDYRGAIRIYFIFIIRDLAQKRWINWEKEKTNFHYLREMSGKAEFDDFNRSVSYFEIIWYGKREIDAGKFEEVKPNFTRFLDKLGVK